MAMITSRRTFLASSASALTLASGCSPSGEEGADTSAVTDSDAALVPEIDLTDEEIELAEMLFSEFNQDPANEALNNNVAPIVNGRTKYEKLVIARRQLGRDPEKRWFYWAEDDLDSFDYYHIANMGPSVDVDEETTLSTGLTEDTFDLTTDLVEKLIEANYFEHAIDQTLEGNDNADNRVIIALRGAEIISDGGGDDGTIVLKDRRPDHRNPNCTFIVWHRKPDEDDTLQVFKGSTVPSEMHLAMYQSFDGTMYKSSMMPQGFHTRIVGNMTVGSGIHPNTLRQKSVCPVIREPDKTRDFFDVNASVWDPNSSGSRASYVGAHIHAGYWENKSANNWVWKFSSAGCQTICGSVKNDRKSGEIADFMDALGLPAAEANEGPYSSDKYNTTFPMILLSGREARLHAEGAPMSAMRRIRYGSSVDGAANPDHPIVKIQEALGVTADGQFGAGSMLRLIDAQRDGSWQIGAAPDGVVTPDLAATQNIELS